MVKKIKAPAPVDPAYRVCTCGTCQWKVAAPTYDALLGAGWSGCAGKVKQDDKGVAWAFVCATCAKRYPKNLCKMPGGAKFFRSLPAAPPSPFPCIGVEGHETSHPEVEVVPLREVMS
jgi:hypothetical protein